MRRIEFLRSALSYELFAFTGLLSTDTNQLDACFLFSNHSTRNAENVLVVFRPRIPRADFCAGRSAGRRRDVTDISADGAALRRDVFLHDRAAAEEAKGA